MIDELQAAQQRLQQAQDVQQRPIQQEAAAKAAVVEAERQLQIVQKKKADEDWQTARKTNAELHQQNLQARDKYRSSFNEWLLRYKKLLSEIPSGDEIQSSAAQLEAHARSAVGNLQRAAMIERTSAHPDESGYESAAQVGITLSNAVSSLHGAWTIPDVLGALVRDADDEMDRRARMSTVYVQWGGELSLGADDESIQRVLDAALYSRLTGWKG